MGAWVWGYVGIGALFAVAMLTVEAALTPRERAEVHQAWSWSDPGVIRPLVAVVSVLAWPALLVALAVKAVTRIMR